jgi:protein TonB
MKARRAILTLAASALLSAVLVSPALAVSPYGQIVSDHAKKQIKFFLDHYPLDRPGVVAVAFSLDASGNVLYARVSHSSGNAQLDTLAVDAIRRAAPFPAATDGHTSHPFVVPVRFDLRPPRRHR